MISYKYGARIYKFNPNYVCIAQTVRKSDSEEYVIDKYSNNKQVRKHIDINDDKKIADAIRHAVVGKLR